MGALRAGAGKTTLLAHANALAHGHAPGETVRERVGVRVRVVEGRAEVQKTTPPRPRERARARRALPLGELAYFGPPGPILHWILVIRLAHWVRKMRKRGSPRRLSWLSSASAASLMRVTSSR